jgi:sarcosine oxidase
MGNGYDVVIAGLGAMGGAIAYHLARGGARVLGFDRYSPPHAYGSSHGRTRVIREAYFEDPVYVPLAKRARQLWRELEAATGRALLYETGAVMLGAPESEAIRGSRRSALEHALPHEVLTVEQVRERFPGFEPDPGMVGLYEPAAGALMAEECVRAHLGAAAAAGAELRRGETLQEWSDAGDHLLVRTSRARYRTASVVLALGAWLPELLPQLPLQVERQVQCWFRPAAGAPPVSADRAPIFLWQLAGGELFYGLPDFGHGVKVARHHGGKRTSASSERRVVAAADVAQVRRFLSRYVPGANGELVDSSVCLYTNTRSGHFLVDRHSEYERIWLISPCSGHGFKFAPVVGERVAAWVLSGERPAELALFTA